MTAAGPRRARAGWPGAGRAPVDGAPGTGRRGLRPCELDLRHRPLQQGRWHRRWTWWPTGATKPLRLPFPVLWPGTQLQP